MAVLGIFIEEVETFEQAHGEQVLTTPSISPLEPESFVLTSPFGTRRSPFTKKLDAHPGLDMAAETGTAIAHPRMESWSLRAAIPPGRASPGGDTETW